MLKSLGASASESKILGHLYLISCSSSPHAIQEKCSQCASYKPPNCVFLVVWNSRKKFCKALHFAFFVIIIVFNKSKTNINKKDDMQQLLVMFLSAPQRHGAAKRQRKRVRESFISDFADRKYLQQKKRYFIFCFTKAKGIRTTEGNALSVEKYLIKTLFKETEQSL